MNEFYEEILDFKNKEYKELSDRLINEKRIWDEKSLQ
jgi:hypothetical protein